MKVCVLGLWHLGTVTAACLASAGHEVVGLDVDAAVVARLGEGTPPLFEPGLQELVRAGLDSGRLRFTTDIAQATSHADIVWVAYDTPVDDDDRGDVEYVVERVTRLFPYVTKPTLILISSQVPVGTTRRLEERFASHHGNTPTVQFGYSPENLRLGKAIEAFSRPDRVVVGLRSEQERGRVAELLKPFTEHIEWMSVESAEMTKHAVNAFLATSVTFINEVAALCEQTGADAAEVARGLKSEVRIGPRAYLSPGDAIAGGTLARDIGFLSELGRTYGLPIPLLSSVKTSNDAHRQWASRRLTETLGSMEGRTVAVWGLTYKPGTDTLRRSSSVELCRWLHGQRAVVRAHDPAVKALPSDLQPCIGMAETPVGAVDGASALVVATPWPDYRKVAGADLVSRMTRCLVLDANRFLADTIGATAGVEYLSVGKGSR